MISSESHTAKAKHIAHSDPIIKQEQVQQPIIISDAPVQTTEFTPAVSRTTTPVVKEKRSTRKFQSRSLLRLLLNKMQLLRI